MVALSAGSNENRKTRLRNGRTQEVFVAFLDRKFMLTETMKTRPKSPCIKQHLRKEAYVT